MFHTNIVRSQYEFAFNSNFKPPKQHTIQQSFKLHKDQSIVRENIVVYKSTDLGRMKSLVEILPIQHNTTHNSQNETS